MSTTADICNLALSYLGDKADISGISPEEESSQAGHCARFFPIARDEILQAYNWSFATKRARLARLAKDKQGWPYVYAVPSDMLHAISVSESLGDSQTTTYRASGATPEVFEFQIEKDADGQRLLYTDCPTAVLRYTRWSEDSRDYPAFFTDALAWLLASHLAGAVIGGVTGAKLGQTCMQQYQMLVAAAIERDLTQRHASSMHLPGWMSFRRGLDYGTY